MKLIKKHLRRFFHPFDFSQYSKEELSDPDFVIKRRSEAYLHAFIVMCIMISLLSQVTN